MFIKENINQNNRMAETTVRFRRYFFKAEPLQETLLSPVMRTMDATKS